MAQAAAGWLVDTEAGDRPARRALNLLGSFLDDEQKETAERTGGFTHRIDSRLFWIPLVGPPKCAFLDRGEIESYCIAPEPGEPMPEADVALTYLLWIRADPEGFLHEANVIRKQDFDTDATEVELLAMLRGPRQLAKPRRRKKRPPSRTGARLMRASDLL